MTVLAYYARQRFFPLDMFRIKVLKTEILSYIFVYKGSKKYSKYVQED